VNCIPVGVNEIIYSKSFNVANRFDVRFRFCDRRVKTSGHGGMDSVLLVSYVDGPADAGGVELNKVLQWFRACAYPG